MADTRDPHLVRLLEERIRVVFGPADIKVGKEDFSGRYEVLGKPGSAGQRQLLTRIPDMWLKGNHLVKIHSRLREALEELEG